MPTLSCGCPTHPGRSVTDPTTHEAWHALVVGQGGPAGVVNDRSLRALRGFGFGTPTETSFDTNARETGKRASGKLREASR